MKYVLKDHQGSLAALVNEKSGTEYFSFDAWGRRRNAQTWTYENMPASFGSTRGFTMHSLSREERNGKHLYGFQFINPDTLHCIALSRSATANFSLHCVCENQASADMNGRMGVYPERHSLFGNPVVSRMLSHDNFVQAPDFSQSFNR